MLSAASGVRAIAQTGRAAPVGESAVMPSWDTIGLLGVAAALTAFTIETRRQENEWCAFALRRAAA